MAIDEAKLNEFMGNFVRDMGAVVHAATVVVGDQLGLYKALAHDPMTAEQLAAATETDPRYVREWLCAQAAGGYAQYDAATERFSLTPEQAFALAQEDSPAFIPGAFQAAMAMFHADAQADRRVPQRRRHRLARARTRAVRRHRALLPARLRGEPGDAAGCRRSTAWWRSSSAAARVADVGCGHGASTIIMAQAYPNSQLRRLRLPRAVDRATRGSPR